MSSGIYNGLNDGMLNGQNDGLLTGTANGLYSNINNSLEKEAIKLISVGVFSSNEIIAVNTLIKSFKRFNLWDKYYAIYPFLGATASSCKWNIKDIRDEDSAFRLIYPNGSSYFNFTNYGMEFTGVQKSYAVTNLIPSIVFKGSDAFSMGCYVNGGTLTGGPYPSTMGTSSTADKEQTLSLRTSGKYFIFQGEVLSFVSTSNTNYTGFFYGNSAPVGSNATLFRNQTAIGTQLVTDATKLSTTPMWLGNINVNSGDSSLCYSNVRMGIALIGKSLNSAEYSLLQMTIQQFVKSLNRE